MADLSEMIFKRWEKMVSLFMEQLVQDRSFLSQMGRLLEGSALFRMTVEKSLLRGLESLQLPTRRDLEEAVAATQRIEAELARVQATLTRLEEKLAAPAPRRPAAKRELNG